MAAPSGTVWGSIAGGYGRIGLHVSLSSTNTTTTATVQVWFWSKYSVSDMSNTLYFDFASSASTNNGTYEIDTTVASGDGWSTSNQVPLNTFSASYTRGTSAVTNRAAAKLTNIDRVGAAMYASAIFIVPALTSYSVSYNANGGTGAPGGQTKFYGKTLKLSSTKPTRTGYTFQGWATSSSATSAAYAAGANYTGNAAVTFYAVWKAVTYTIAYNANGGSGAPSSQTKTYGTTLKLSTTKPTRTDYTFKGWATSATATSAAYVAGANYTANSAATLYAVWELSYVKPRITNLSVTRCDASGTAADSGEHALVSFKWACDKTISSIKIDFNGATGNVELSATISASGTSGTVSKVVGGTLSNETSYTYALKVTDAGGYTTEVGTLPGGSFPIDFLPGGKGVGIGKAAEIRNLMDVQLRTRLLGGYLYPVLEPETDLNDVRKPNNYTGANVTDYQYANCPCESGTFTLIVESCGAEGQVRQTYINCSKYKPQVFVRVFYQNNWGAWMFATTSEMILYEDSSGSNGTITLKYSAAHYKYLEIHYTDNNNKGGGYTKVLDPNGKVLHLGLQEAGANIYFRQTAYAINGTSITPTIAEASYVRITQAGVVSTSVGSNYIKIKKVVGLA